MNQNTSTTNFVNKWDYFDYLINKFVESTFFLHDWERLKEKQENKFKKAICGDQIGSIKKIQDKYMEQAKEVLAWK